MKTKFSFFTFFLLLCISIYAQKSDKSYPKSIELKLNDEYSFSSSKKIFGKLNIIDLQREDEDDEKNGLPPRFGYPLDVNLNTTNSGTWKILSNGARIWRLEIQCVEAISINLLYDKFWLPKGAKFHLYSKNKSQVIGGFSSVNNRGTKDNPGKFTTGLLFSESITLELFEPLSVKNQSIISVDKVVHGYREIDLKNTMTDEVGHGDSGPCQVNINCLEGNNWQNEKKGIAMFLVSGIRWCTGSLINNTANDQKPYFLTADHCIGSLDAYGDTDASYYSFWWNYESSTCISDSTDFFAESTSGATLVANNTTSDFALFELTESPVDNNIDVYFNGWDRTTSPTQGGVGIHHPKGDFKKIATHNVIPSNGIVYGASTHWRVNWLPTTNGFSVTEKGSSGSPLFTNNKRIIGQLHGGSNINCLNPANDPGEYGKFHVSWNGPSSKRRLKDWLDPTNTNQIFLDGIPSTIFQNDVDIVCNSDIIFTLQGISSTPTWSKSYNLSTISSNNNNITVKAVNSNVGGQGYVRATFPNGTFIQEDFWVGKANVDYVSFSNGIGETGYFCSSHNDNKYYLYPSWSNNSGVSHQIRIKKYPNLNIVYQPSQVFFGNQGTLNYYPPPGWYLFEVKRTNACGVSQWFGFEVEFVDCTLGGGGGEEEFEFFAYPNPSSETIFIQKNNNETPNLQKSKIEYKLFDLNSNLIANDYIFDSKTSIDVSKFKKGKYILKIYGIKKEETHNIIIK